MSSKELCSRTRRSARIAAARSVLTKLKDGDRQLHQQMATESFANNNTDCEHDEMMQTQEQPYESQFSQEEEDGSLLSLNDDCLLEVFGRLEMKDLCAVKDCCRRFSDLAISVVQKGFRKKEYDEFLRLPCKPRLSDEDFPEKALMVTKFGEFITHVEIVGYHKDAWRIGPILKNCTSVKSLRLRNVSLGIVPVLKLAKMFENIETLELFRCRVSTRKLAGILKATKSLKNILIYGQMSLSFDLLSAIVAHENIESIRLRITGNHDASAAEFLEYAKQLQPLRNLKNLEILYMPHYNGFAPVMDVLATIESLEDLTLSWFIPDETFFKTLDTFANLKFFKMHTYKDVSDATLAAATNFTATKQKNNGYSLDGFGKMPKYTHSLMRKD